MYPIECFEMIEEWFAINERSFLRSATECLQIAACPDFSQQSFFNQAGSCITMTKTDFKEKIVRLNVGGTHYEVSRNTLERCEGSMLASLISYHWKEGNSDEEPIFIDRNGRLFEYVLDYLRTNKVYLPYSASRDAVKEEFEFYGIDADMTKVNEKYGIEYTHALVRKIKAKQSDLDALKHEKLAIQASHLAEAEFLKQDTPCLSVTVKLSYSEYGSLQRRDELLECLRARGLEYVSNGRGSASYPVPINEFRLSVKKASS